MKTFMNKERGITLFIAMIITATLLLISTGVAITGAREVALSTTSRDSQFAFYAADTGAECAIYWDVSGSQLGVQWSAFASTSPFGTQWTANIRCNRDQANFVGNGPVVNHTYSGGFATSTFTIKYLPQPYCSQVTVVKGDDGSTKIESLGFNTCDATNGRRVERAVRVTY